jgi:DNA-binding NarL/FixJ family response regulator
MTVGSAGDTGAEAPVSVMVADSRPAWREAAARNLTEAGFHVVATAGDGPEAVRRARATRPQVLLLDLGLPGASGAALCGELVADDPAVRVLVLTAGGDPERQDQGEDQGEDQGQDQRHGPEDVLPEDLLEAVASGATGCLPKSASRDELVEAVARTAGGDPVFTPELAGLVLGEYARLAAASPSSPSTASSASSTSSVPSATSPQPAGRPVPPRLTGRETEALRLVAKGLSHEQIAHRLAVPHRAVHDHLQNTLGKLQRHHRVERVRYATARGPGADRGPAPYRGARAGEDGDV